PANTTEVVLEAGHCPHDEVPDQVNRAMLEWLQDLPQL
ncbi:MAG: alpha/beta hydrolase, partial [Vulcanococcus sp.]